MKCERHEKNGSESSGGAEIDPCEILTTAEGSEPGCERRQFARRSQRISVCRDSQAVQELTESPSGPRATPYSCRPRGARPVGEPVHFAQAVRCPSPKTHGAPDEHLD